MKLRPLNHHVLVQRNEADERTPGGIIIPGNAKEKPVQGEVLAVGSGKILPSGEIVPLDVKPGNVVLFGKYAGTEVEIDGKKAVMLTYDDLFAVFE